MPPHKVVEHREDEKIIENATTLPRFKKGLKHCRKDRGDEFMTDNANSQGS